MKWQTEASKAGKPDDVYTLTSTVDCDVIRPMIKGKINDRYYGREVVSFSAEAGIWGTTSPKVKNGFKKARLFTLHNGILNQCSLETPPTPYWAVLDAASDLKTGFKKQDLIDKAVKLVGEAHRKACHMAYDVLRNHHRHARKRMAGMSHMIDTLPNCRLLIRGRGADETVAYFDSEGERNAEAAKFMSELSMVAEVDENEVDGLNC